jgi:hypothetical protein
MRIKSVFLFVLPLLIVATAAAQTTPTAQKSAPENSSIVGVWRAQADGLPFIALTVTDESGSLSGAVLFYFHRREQGQPITSTPGQPEPLFNPRFDGQTLTFQVSHRRAHPPKSLSDPPVSFRLKLTGPNKAELVNEDEPSSVGLELLKAEY